MRIKVDLNLSNYYLPKDYRRGFISLIKAILEKEAPVKNAEFYNDKTIKPFTFSVYFPELQGAEGEYLHVGEKATLQFSTNDLELLTYFYNGTVKMKEHQWGDITFRLKKAKSVFNRKIKKDTCTFKSLSPFLVNNKGDNLSYLKPDDEGFDESFRHSVKELGKHFLRKKEVDFEYSIKQNKKMVVSHYNQSMTCNKGIIEMQAEPDLLELLYNVGIGIRRSQGFGMVELV